MPAERFDKNRTHQIRTKADGTQSPFIAQQFGTTIFHIITNERITHFPEPNPKDLDQFYHTSSTVETLSPFSYIKHDNANKSNYSAEIALICT